MRSFQWGGGKSSNCGAKKKKSVSWQGSVNCFVPIAIALWTCKIESSIGAWEHCSTILLHLINCFSESVDSETRDKTDLWIQWVATGYSLLRYISLVMCPSIWAPADRKIPCAFSPRARDCSIISLKNRFYFPNFWVSCFLMLSLSQFLFSASWKPKKWFQPYQS